ncbi:MAG: hypothetical protein FWE97_00370 [Dehalococcoidia bacterium]|nr:hypothetical protein [Dehalococcoidia bacterium]
MKSRIARILGVAITAIMLVGILPLATPAMAATQAWDESADWTKGSLPSIKDLVLAPTLLEAGPMAQSPIDGKIYVYALFGAPPTGADPDDYPPAGPALIMSDNAGATWKVLDGFVPGRNAAGDRNTINTSLTGADDVIIEIVCSTKDAGVIFFVTKITLFQSNNGGKDFENVADVWGGNKILSMDVAVRADRHFVFVGLNSWTEDDMPGGVYFWAEGVDNDVFTAYGSTNSSGVGSFGEFDVWAVKAAPTFGTDRAVFALGTSGTQVLVRASVNGNPWGGSAVTWFADVDIASVPKAGGGSILVPPATITAADIAFPFDFDVTTPAKSNFVFCVASSAAFDADNNAVGVYRVCNNIAERFTSGSTSGDSGGNGVPDNNGWNNISMYGNTGSGTRALLVGNADGRVIQSTNFNNIYLFGAGRVTFSGVTVPNSVNTTAWVLVDKDYVQTQRTYILNVDSGTWGGFSVAVNSRTYLQRSLIDDDIQWIVDLAVADNGDMFLITSDNSTHNSLWRLLGGEAWERLDVFIFSAANTYVYDRLALSPNYVTDNTIFMWSKGSVLAGGSNDQKNAILMRSTENGFAFSRFGRVVTGTPADPVAGTLAISGIGYLEAVLVLDANNVIVGDEGVALWSRSGNNYTHTVPTTLDPAKNVIIYDIKAASNGDLFASYQRGNSNNVGVYKSTNGGRTWQVLKDEIVNAWGLSKAIVAPADDYEDSGNIFISIDSGRVSTRGIYRYTDVKAKGVDDGKFIRLFDAAANRWVSDMVAAPGAGSDDEGNGMIYAIGANTYRVRGAWSYSERIDPRNADFSLVSRGDSWYSRILALVQDNGDVTLYVTNAGEIWSYTDTLNRAGTGLKYTGSTYFDRLTQTSNASFSWDEMKNADSYAILVATKDLGSYVKLSNYVGAYNEVFAVGGPVVELKQGITDTKYTVAGLDPGIEYYVYVFAEAPVTSFAYTALKTFITAPQSVIATTVLQTHGQNYAPTSITGGVVLGWDFWLPITYTASDVTFRVQVANNPAFTGNLLLNTTTTAASSSTNVLVPYTTAMAYSTNYYWRVSIENGSGMYTWANSNWKTVDAPEPVITIPAQQPQPTPTIIVTVNPQPFPEIPTPIINMPETPKQDTPFYIWLIVGIGAILTIAVIVLIVRTRRVV